MYLRNIIKKKKSHGPLSEALQDWAIAGTLAQASRLIHVAIVWLTWSLSIPIFRANVKENNTGTTQIGDCWVCIKQPVSLMATESCLTSWDCFYFCSVYKKLLGENPMGKWEIVIKPWKKKKKKCSITQINRSWCVLPALGSVERGFSAGFGGIRIGLGFSVSQVLSTLREK